MESGKRFLIPVETVYCGADWAFFVLIQDQHEKNAECRTIEPLSTVNPIFRNKKKTMYRHRT